MNSMTLVRSRLQNSFAQLQPGQQVRALQYGFKVCGFNLDIENQDYVGAMVRLCAIASIDQLLQIERFIVSMRLQYQGKCCERRERRSVGFVEDWRI